MGRRSATSRPPHQNHKKLGFMFQGFQAKIIDQLISDLKELNLPFDDEYIGGFSKEAYKKVVSSKIQEGRIQYLTNLQAHKKKSKYLEFKNEPSAYFLDTRFSKEQCDLLFSIRSRSLNTKDNTRERFKSNPFCDICKIFLCTMFHPTQCSPVLAYMKEAGMERHTVPDISWVYGNNDQQLEFIRKFQSYYKARTEILSRMRSQGTNGECDSFAAR